jgi:hypothetical protein
MTTIQEDPSQGVLVMGNKDARYLNLLLGIWLFISAFLWKHSPAQFTNTWLMGVITVIVALVATSMPAARYVNTAVGIWLIISGFALPHYRAGTVWNNVLVGIAIGLLSLVGSRADLTTRKPLTRSA